jgi:hypothetical protein
MADDFEKLADHLKAVDTRLGSLSKLAGLVDQLAEEFGDDPAVQDEIEEIDELLADLTDLSRQEVELIAAAAGVAMPSNAEEGMT